MSFIEVLIYGKKLEEKLRKTSSIVVHSMENNPLSLSLSLSLSLKNIHTQRKQIHVHYDTTRDGLITKWLALKITW